MSLVAKETENRKDLSSRGGKKRPERRKGGGSLRLGDICFKSSSKMGPALEGARSVR